MVFFFFGKINDKFTSTDVMLRVYFGSICILAEGTYHDSRAEDIPFSFSCVMINFLGIIAVCSPVGNN